MRFSGHNSYQGRRFRRFFPHLERPALVFVARLELLSKAPRDKRVTACVRACVKSGLCEIAQAPLTDLPPVLADTRIRRRVSKTRQLFGPSHAPWVFRAHQCFGPFVNQPAATAIYFRAHMMFFQKKKNVFFFESRESQGPARYRREMFSGSAETITGFAI